MAYSVVTATDVPDLFSELELFAEAQGWTVVWNTGTQIGLNNARNCYAAFGVSLETNPSVETDTYPDPDVTVMDYKIHGSLGKSFAGHASHYWGLSGSPITAHNTDGRVTVNDLTGPFSEVHFFGDEDSIFVVVRSDTDRWTHFGFGTLDKKGMTHPDCAFMIGMHWRYWDNTFKNGIAIKAKCDYAPSSGSGGNRLWFRDGYTNHQLYLPDGVLDPAFGIADDVISFNGMQHLPQMRAQPGQDAYTNFNNARMMDHWPWARQKPVTGGLPLLSVPVIFGTGSFWFSWNNDLMCFIGDLPRVRLCDISSVAIGEDIIYGAETYAAFPVKRRAGLTYDGKANSYLLGVAFKKD